MINTYDFNRQSINNSLFSNHVNFKYYLNSNTVIKSAFSSSLIKNQFDDASLSQIIDEKKNKYLTQNYTYLFSISSHITKHNFIKIGFTLKRDIYELNNKVLWEKRIDSIGHYELIDDVYNDEKGFGTMVQSYINYKFNFTDNLFSTFGVHYLFFGVNKKHSIEPRWGGGFRFKRHSFGFALGLHSMVEPLPTYLTLTGKDGSKENNNLDFTKAAHFVLKYEFSLSNFLLFKTETYLQYFFDVPITYATNNSVLNEQDINTISRLVNKGGGKNYGVEFSLERLFHNDYYFSINASLYRSLYFGSDSTYRDSRYDGKYILNFVYGKDIQYSKSKKIGISVSSKFYGGQRCNPINLQKSILSNSTEYDLDLGYTDKLNDYFRMDIQLYHQFISKHVTHRISLDVQNITNRKNEFSKYYSPITQEIKSKYQLGLIPIINYRIDF